MAKEIYNKVSIKQKEEIMSKKKVIQLGATTFGEKAKFVVGQRK